MTRRLKLIATLAPGVIIAGLWNATPRAAAVSYGPPCATGQCGAAGPCSPDGACWPKYDTWGWYPTRWRAFPGDVVSTAPTEAEKPEPSATPDEAISGPQPPDASREGQAGPEKPESEGGAGPDAGLLDPPPGLPAPDIGPAPAEAPATDAPAAEVPAAEPPAFGEESAFGEEAIPAPQRQPDAQGAPTTNGQEEQPFGAAAPQTHSIIAQANAEFPVATPAQVVNSLEPTSHAEPVAPVVLHYDDAPPELPTSLLEALNSAPAVIAPFSSVTSADFLVGDSTADAPPQLPPMAPMPAIPTAPMPTLPTATVESTTQAFVAPSPMSRLHAEDFDVPADIAAMPAKALATSPSAPMPRATGPLPTLRSTSPAHGRVVPASAVAPAVAHGPQSAKFVAPALGDALEGDGAEQAIYFEASDWVSDQK